MAVRLPIALLIVSTAVALIGANILAEDQSTSSSGAPEFDDDAYFNHVESLKKRLPHAGFSIVIQKPFVVIGDEPPEIVKQRSTQTVEWAVNHLKSEYFANDPKEIIDIWLFQDANSYTENTENLTGTKPSTPYGFYSPYRKALFMNISTGGGTLVHEIVHPFMESNFPDCPSWFNEGLASLYEQSGERDGRIIGLTNWRLRGLQSAIRKESLLSFEKLCGTKRHEFYDQGSGANYAQARYLCYYLQEHGLLKKFYHRFRANVKADLTGYRTLKSILGEDDLDAFKTRWEAEVMKLKFD